MKKSKIADALTRNARLVGMALSLVLICSVLTQVTDAQITGEVREGKIVVISSEPTELAGLDLISEGGLLEPVPEAAGAAPFSFFLSNTANQITWGNLGSSVTLDGEWETQAGYLGDDPATDLAANWGRGAESVAFPVNNVPEPTSALLACFGLLGFLGFRARRSSSD